MVNLIRGEAASDTPGLHKPLKCQTRFATSIKNLVILNIQIFNSEGSNLKVGQSLASRISNLPPQPLYSKQLTEVLDLFLLIVDE